MTAGSPDEATMRDRERRLAHSLDRKPPADRNRTAVGDALETTMAWLEHATGEQADTPEQLGELREAASIFMFRVVFVVIMERRGLLYAAGDEASGSSFLYLQDLGRELREHTSIFRNRPTDDFSPGLESWLAGLDAATPELANDVDRLRAWDRLIAQLDALAAAQIRRYELKALAGGSVRVERILGDIYEQLLAASPSKSKRTAVGAHYTPEPLVIEVVLGALEPAFAGAWARADRQPERYCEELLELRVLDPAMGCGHFLTAAALEIARELAWVEIDGQPRPADAFEVWPAAIQPGVEHHHDPWTRVDRAKRGALDRIAATYLADVVQSCCHGVDVQPLAIELGKLALRMLITIERQAHGVDGCEAPNLGEALRCGDSLRGVDEHAVQSFLREVYGVIETLAERILRQRWAWDLAFLYDWHGQSENALWEAIVRGDATAENTWAELLGGVGEVQGNHRRYRDRVRAMARDLRAFHWPLEFHEVFHRCPRGFDVNPPFLGSQAIRAAFGHAGTDYLRLKSGVLVDLCGAFILRFGDLLNDRSAFGVVAPNSIAQAKMRRLVLVPLAREFEICRASASQPWSGEAAVHVAILHMHRRGPGLTIRRRIVEACDPYGNIAGRVAVRSATAISSFLDDGPETELCELAGQSNISFQGMIGRGSFDRPLEFAKRVPKRERRALYACLNNRDIQQQPAPHARRVVIDVTDSLADVGLVDATSQAQERWLKSHLPTLYAALRDTVRPERRALSDARRNDRLRSSWWLFENPRMALRSAWQGHASVIVIGAVGKTMIPQLIDRVDASCGLSIVPTHQLFVIPSSSRAVLALLTSRVFETFTRRACSSLKSDLRFTPTEVFPFYPFPWLGGSADNPHRAPVLNVPEAVERRLAGPMRALVDLREAILVHPERHALPRARVGGPTDLYNLFDDPKCEVAAIQRLRAAHHALELAVLAEYGWQDLHGPWTFARPWLDGTWRHVPPAATRRAYLERLAALNYARAGDR